MDTRLIRPEDRCRSTAAAESWPAADALPAHFRSEAFAEDLGAEGVATSLGPSAPATGARAASSRRRRGSPLAAIAQALAAPFLAQRPARG